MNKFRWWMFKKLTHFVWWVCPELHKTNLQNNMKYDNNWRDKNYGG